MTKKDDKPETTPEEELQKSISVAGQYIKDISFESPKAPESLMDQGEHPKIDISIDVTGNKIGDDTFESSLRITATASRDSESIYIAEVTYSGLFNIKNIPDNEMEMVLLIYCPNLLFPYVRRIISDVTRDGGFMPLMMDPIDFAQLYAHRKENEEAKKKAN